MTRRMSRIVGLDFACNDPDNGIFAGRIDGLQLYSGGDPVFELEPRRSPAPMLTLLDNGNIRVSGKRWRIIDSRDWVGNWCWNRYFFTAERAADFLSWSRGRGLFNLTCGDSRLYQAWRSEGDIRPLILSMLYEATA